MLPKYSALVYSQFELLPNIHLLSNPIESCSSNSFKFILLLLQLFTMQLRSSKHDLNIEWKFGNNMIANVIYNSHGR